MQAGKWIGPTAISYALKYVVDKHQDVFEQLKVVVCRDGTIFFDKIQSLVESNQKVLVLVPMQLGFNKYIENLEYVQQIHQMFKVSQNVGMIAGHSGDNAVYLFGSYKDNFLYLDPHKINECMPVNNQTWRVFQAKECLKLASTPCSNLSSALACSFYLPSLHDFLMWKNQILNL